MAFPAHALLVVEERIREAEAEGVTLPEGIDRTELALRILVYAGTLSRFVGGDSGK